MAGFWLMFGLDIYTKCLRHPLSLNKEAWGRSHHIYCLTLTSAFPLQSPSRPKVINNDECGFFPVHIWDRWRVTVDNNSLQARALTWLFKKTLQMLTEKQGTKFCGLFFHICLLDDRFFQHAVTGLPACMRISAVAEQHLCLGEMMDRFSAWFSLCLSLPFQTPISQDLFTPCSISVLSCLRSLLPSMLAYGGIIWLEINASVSWPCKESGYGLCCILNLLTCSCVQLGSDGGSSPTVAHPQGDFRYHHDERGCKKAVLLRGREVGFMLWADAAYTLPHPRLLTFVPPTAHHPFGRSIYQSSDKC